MEDSQIIELYWQKIPMQSRNQAENTAPIVCGFPKIFCTATRMRKNA